MKALPARLLVVTERSATDDPEIAARQLLETLDRLLAAGIRWVWFRERDLAPDARLVLGRRVAERVRVHRGTLTVGGDAALAAALEAQGVHLPGGSTPSDFARARGLLPNGLVGVSAHSVPEVEAAARAGADYATVSPIFPSASKPGYGPALGVAALTRAAASGLPVIALGGITTERAPGCRTAGAAGVAVMGPLMRGPNRVEQARIFLDIASGTPDRP